MRVNPNLLETAPPAIAALGPAIRAARDRGPLLDLGQAVPGWGPPPEALARFAELLAEPATHRYSADEGRASLRARWAAVLAERLGHRVDPEHGLLITAGANQAYLMAAMGVLAPGEAVGILSPWYFNHPMAARMIGARVVELRLDPARGYALEPERVLEAVDRERLRALTVVSPSNPTGRSYERAALEALARGLEARGVALISDETYAFFDPEHFSPARAAPEATITLGSFSKLYALTGWRVGYLAGPPSLVAELMKVQDTMIICASHPGQRLVESCLDVADAWLEEKRAMLARRRAILEAWARGLGGGWRLDSAGPFFALLSGPLLASESFKRLLEAQVVALPATAFGAGLERSLRLSLGAVDEVELREALARVAQALEIRMEDP